MEKAGAEARTTARTRERDWSDWIVVAGCLGCQVGMGAGAYVFSAFLKPITDDLGWSRTAFAGAHPIMSTTVALLGPLVGWFSERRGPRVVLLLGGAVMGGALLAAARMETSLQFYAIAIAIGLAAACLGDLSTGAAIADRFAGERSRVLGRALGIVYVGSSIGGALGVVVGARLAAAGSWRSALAVLAVALWVIVLPSALAVGRPAVRRARDARRPPRDAAGSDPLASREESGGQGEDDEVGARSASLAVRPVAPAQALRTRDFWALFWALFAFYVYRLGLNTHLVAFLSDLGYSQGEAAFGFGATLAIGMVGKLLAGGIADRVGIPLAVTGNFVGLFAASCLLLSPADAFAIPLFLALHGITTAAEDVVIPLLIAHRFGATHLARIYGFLLLALVPGGYVGPLVAGQVFDATGSYSGVFALFAVTNASALVAVWLVAFARPRSA